MLKFYIMNILQSYVKNKIIINIFQFSYKN